MLDVASITPQCGLWSDFVALYRDSVQRRLSATRVRARLDACDRDQERILVERLEHGQRGLFLLRDGGAALGLAEAWLESGPVRTLHVCDFYIAAAHQRKGLGQALWYAVVQWGRCAGARRIRVQIEVDEPASVFWQKLGLQALSIADRRIEYGMGMPDLRLSWIRHGEIAPLDHLEVCPTDEEISLAQSAADLATSLGTRLLGPPEGQQIFSSPQRRARETAQALSSHSARYVIAHDSALCEFFPVELIGMRLDDIEARYGADYEHRLIHTPLDMPFAASESAHAAVRRVSQFMEHVGSASITCALPVIVSHQNLHNLFVAHVLGANLNQSGRLHLQNLHATTFIYDPYTKRFEIESLNVPL